MYDIIIVGGGPAGLTAALYARRAEKKVLVIEKEIFGGQITFSPKVENIPGFIELSGNDFAEKLVEQVLNLDADVEMTEVTAIKNGDVKTVVTADGEFQAIAVIIATGARHRRLGLAREDEFVGNGISFCAVCDGAFFTGKTVAVVGGGNSALQEALLLSDLAKKVYVIQNLDFLTGEEALQKQLYARENITVITGSTVAEYLGDGELNGIKIQNSDGVYTDISLDGVFLAIGLIPQNEPFCSVAPIDERGYIISDEGCVCSEGIFVAGDCRTKKIRQVTTAAADGATAALAACDYIGRHN